VWGVVDPGFKCVAFDLLAAASVADVCVVMRREGKGTGQIGWVPAAADVPVATEKKVRGVRRDSAAAAVSGGGGKSAGRLQSCPAAAAALQCRQWST